MFNSGWKWQQQLWITTTHINIYPIHTHKKKQITKLKHQNHFENVIVLDFMIYLLPAVKCIRHRLTTLWLIEPDNWGIDNIREKEKKQLDEILLFLWLGQFCRRFYFTKQMKLNRLFNGFVFISLPLFNTLFDKCNEYLEEYMWFYLRIAHFGFWIFEEWTMYTLL